MTRDEVITTLWQTGESGGVRRPYLYAVMDAAADDRIYPKLVEMQDEMEVACLYKGETAEALATVAPYLVRLNPNLRLFDWWWENGWGANWGIFAWSTASFETVYEHFRQHTKVRIEDGEVLIFRFYDPQAISEMLPLLVREQRSSLFGPMTRIAFAADGEALLQVDAEGSGTRMLLITKHQMQTLNERFRERFAENVIAELVGRYSPPADWDDLCDLSLSILDDIWLAGIDDADQIEFILDRCLANFCGRRPFPSVVLIRSVLADQTLPSTLKTHDLRRREIDHESPPT